MPRYLSLDALGTLHHVVGRRIECARIFQSDADRTDFMTRVAERCRDGSWTVYAWALTPKHFHLLVRTATARSPRACESF
jgi:putative transposase